MHPPTARHPPLGRRQLGRSAWRWAVQHGAGRVQHGAGRHGAAPAARTAPAERAIATWQDPRHCRRPARGGAHRRLPVGREYSAVPPGGRPGSKYPVGAELPPVPIRCARPTRTACARAHAQGTRHDSVQSSAPPQPTAPRRASFAGEGSRGTRGTRTIAGSVGRRADGVGCGLGSGAHAVLRQLGDGSARAGLVAQRSGLAIRTRTAAEPDPIFPLVALALPRFPLLLSAPPSTASLASTHRASALSRCTTPSARRPPPSDTGTSYSGH